VASAIPLRLLIKGEPLDRVEEETRTILPLLRVKDVADIVVVYRQGARALAGRTRDLASFDDGEFDQAAFEARLDRISPMVVGWYRVARLRACVLAGDHAQALAAGEEARRLLPFFAGTTAARDFHIFHALAGAALFSQASAPEQERWLSTLHEHTEKLARWAAANPATFRHSHALLAAELARLEARPEEAAGLYEESIQEARAQGFLGDEALAYERAAAFYRERGALSVATALAGEARSCYLRWGAEGKARQIQRLYPRLAPASPPFAAGSTVVTRSEDIDLLSVVKTSQALSGEVLRENLVRTLMQVLLAQSGAACGTLLLVRDGSLGIEAEADSDERGTRVRRLHGMAATSSPALPHGIVQYVWRTGERLALDDARAEPRFARDDYLARVQPRSVLCMPIRRQAEVVGILYLENAALAGAFTPQRLFVLELLAAQAAISLENARFVEQEHAARAAAEQGRARAALMAEASALLSESLDFRVVLERLATLMVRHLADWCIVDLVERGQVRRVAGAHREVEKAAALLGQQDRYPRIWTPSAAVSNVIRSGEAFFAAGSATDGGAGSVMSVPLLIRGEVVGTITLATDQGGRAFERDDLALAQEIAQRAATAVDNARLYLSAQDSVRLRDEFLSVASHELNTPMTAMMLTLQGLSSDVPAVDERTAQWRQMVGLAERQGRRLSRLVEELLDATRIHRGDLPLRLEAVDLGRTVKEAVDRYQPEIARAGYRVALELAPGVCGRWDPLRLEQVVLNLLSNALKFGGGQPVEVKVEPAGEAARLSVTDHGMGIEPELQARIFDRFVRGVSATHFGGLGLGLYISREIVSGLGGTIEVKSQRGQGATFTVTLPCAGPLPPIAVTASEEGAAS
jgi:signal transduction histidine kinase